MATEIANRLKNPYADSLEVSAEIQDQILHRVAQNAWENELISKFQDSYVRKKAVAPVTYLIDLARDVKDDDYVLAKGKGQQIKSDDEEAPPGGMDIYCTDRLAVKKKKKVVDHRSRLSTKARKDAFLKGRKTTGTLFIPKSKKYKSSIDDDKSSESSLGGGNQDQSPGNVRKKKLKHRKTQKDLALKPRNQTVLTDGGSSGSSPSPTLRPGAKAGTTPSIKVEEMVKTQKAKLDKKSGKASRQSAGMKADPNRDLDSMESFDSKGSRRRRKSK